MKKNLILLIAMVLVMSVSEAKDCLPKKMSNVRNNPKYLVKTVSGDTYQQAKAKLELQMPKAGFLQNIKHKEVKKLTSGDYLEQVTLSKKLKAKVDLWLTYNCKHQGDYLVTAVVPVEGITYVDYWYPKDFWNLKNVKKKCKGYNKIVLLATEKWNNFAYTSEKAYKYEFTKKTKRKSCNYDVNNRFCNWYIMCGEVKLRLGKGRHGFAEEYSNDFENFSVIVTHDVLDRPDVKHVTVDYWLELTKDLQ